MSSRDINAPSYFIHSIGAIWSVVAYIGNHRRVTRGIIACAKEQIFPSQAQIASLLVSSIQAILRSVAYLMGRHALVKWGTSKTLAGTVVIQTIHFIFSFQAILSTVTNLIKYSPVELLWTLAPSCGSRKTNAVSMLETYRSTNCMANAKGTILRHQRFRTRLVQIKTLSPIWFAAPECRLTVDFASLFVWTVATMVVPIAVLVI